MLTCEIMKASLHLPHLLTRPLGCIKKNYQMSPKAFELPFDLMGAKKSRVCSRRQGAHFHNFRKRRGNAGFSEAKIKKSEKYSQTFNTQFDIFRFLLHILLKVKTIIPKLCHYSFGNIFKTISSLIYSSITGVATGGGA